jgi:uncharacterized protein
MFSRQDDPKNRGKTACVIRDLLTALGRRVSQKENEVNNSHMSALRMKHAELEDKLEREENRPFPDSNLIHSLKKQKLHLKDVLTQETLPA